MLELPVESAEAAGRTTARLAAFVENGLARSRPLTPDYQRLWRSLGEATEGGKRFRPALVHASYTALGGRDVQLAAHVGAAVELLHTALVIHDDVIDGDDTRRGRPNVSGTFSRRAVASGVGADRAAELGRTAGILAGDLALVGATRMLAGSDTDAGTVHRLLGLLDRTVFLTAAGELSDVAFSLVGDRLGAVSLAEVITMEEQKTAVYSFELPLQAGAVLAGADEARVSGLGEMGRLVGIAFQLFDDLLGVFGDEGVTGKSGLTDLRQGRLTPLIAHARHTPAWVDIAPLVGDAGLTESQARVVREALTSSGSRRFIETLAARYVRAALRQAVALELPADLVRWMTAMTDDLARRAA